jgi:stage II sporulation protein D
VRVRVARVRGRENEIEIGRDGQWIRLRREGGSSRGAVLRGPLSIRAGRDGWTVRSDLRFRPWLDGFEWFELTPADGEPRTLDHGDRTFPGALRCVRRDYHERGEFDVINHVALEAYLPGVVGSELFSHWHPETHAAQAVAARSFAASERDYFADRRHYDLADSQRSQVYGGQITRPRAVEAVQATRGLVLAHAGRLVPGYYCSCCGGEAATALDAIGEHPFNDVAPLAGRSGTDVCTEAPLFRWTIARSRREVLRRLRAYGADRKMNALSDLDDLGSIEIVARNPNGRPTRYVVTGEGRRVGSDVGERDLPRVELSDISLRRAVDFSAGDLVAPKKRLWSSSVEVVVDGGEVTFNGRGHGHGVGLCQYGAEALARAGDAHESILRWYYPDVELVRAYG